jgi:hypothetical protein
MALVEIRGGEMDDREWFVPCLVLTGLLGVAALLLMPVAGYDAPPPYLNSFLSWIQVSLYGAILIAVIYLVRLIRLGVENPLRQLCSNIIKNGRSYALLASAMTLAGIDMLFFMWIKPEVTAVSPFWADPLLADVDRFIFGRDPWRFFEGIDLTFHAWAYSFFWAAAIMGTLIWLFAQPRSHERGVSILNYFVLWSLFGPISQLLGSAAGPIFYARIGLGDRFEPLAKNIPEITNRISGYLWNLYATNELGLGAGVSAMPSLHIATVTWVVLVFGSLKSRLTPLAVLLLLYIWAMSVALGWHYAIDGAVGALGAIGSQVACGWYLDRRVAVGVGSVQAVPVS